MNKACSTLGISPVKVQTLSSSAKESILKNKVKKIAESVTSKLNDSFDLNISTEETSLVPQNYADLGRKYEELIIKLKDKMKTVTSTQEKINILSLLPSSWSIQKIQNEFSVSQYLARQSKQLVKTSGILPQTGKKKPSHVIDENVIKCVQDFYQNDEHSRMMPGKKDCVSVRQADGKKINIQKRLILCNLKELYTAFKEKHNLKIGFSKFADLRPKFCVLAGGSGTHSVCVCVTHQNVKLMLSALKMKFDYKILLSTMVCDIENETCMLSQCEKCPGTNEVLRLLQESWDDFDSEIIFKQWVSVDRCELTTQILPFQEYLDKLTENLNNLKRHHFVAKKQANFLNIKKENLLEGECIVMGDFSQNFSFVIQDEVQSYHWSKTYATVHPFLIYFKKEGKLQSQSYCVNSEYLTHNTISFVLLLPKASYK